MSNNTNDLENPMTFNIFDIIDNDRENKPIIPPEIPCDTYLEWFLKQGFKVRPQIPPPGMRYYGALYEDRKPKIEPGSVRVAPLSSLGGWEEIISKDPSVLPEKRPYSDGFLNAMRYSKKPKIKEEPIDEEDNKPEPIAEEVIKPEPQKCFNEILNDMVDDLAEHLKAYQKRKRMANETCARISSTIVGNQIDAMNGADIVHNKDAKKF